MNKIEFLIESHGDELTLKYSTIDLIIDDTPLKEIMREYELPMAKAEGHPKIAGGYAPMETPTGLMDHFLGKTEYWCGSDNKTVLLECECGIIGCWPLLCKIKVKDKHIVWDHFEQPHRSKESAASFWDYSNFKGFTFAKNQYLNALKAVQKNA